MKKIYCMLGALLFLLTGCGAPASYQTDFFAMDTFMSITVWARKEAQAHDIAAEAMQRVNALGASLTRHAEKGSIAALNAANGEAVTLDADAYDVLAAAVSYAALTDGAFDPTTAPLSDLWGIGTEQAALPAAEAIAEACTRVDYRNIELLDGNRARLHNGAQVDLGAIGKGYATDAAAALRAGQPMLVSLGGNVGAYGANPKNKDGTWTIGLANPDNSAEYIATLTVRDASVVTSGDYERFFEQYGVRYHHIFDPKTGYPVQGDLRAVTVADPLSARADAMTTALFVMGLEQGLAFCAEQGIDAVFITADHKLHTTAGLRGSLTVHEGVDYALAS